MCRAVDTSRTRRGAIVALATLLVGWVAAGPVGAYRFWSEFFPEPIAPYADQATKWHPDAWRAGGTLHWEVSRDPDWDVHFDSAPDVLPFVERALESWSEIPTADIAWTLDGVGEAAPGVTEDSVNTVFIDADSGAGGYAAHWEKQDGPDAPWQYHGCDVALGGAFAWLPDGFEEWEPEDREDYQARVREAAVRVLVHEFGHCIGLAHSAMLSTAIWDLAGTPRLDHPGDPAMSYGTDLPQPEDLSRDDMVGASLLRPAPGYRRRTGNIAGAVTMPGLPVDFAVVWALPVGRHPLRDRVGVFTNRTGEFQIEGLDPGDYLLTTQPIVDFLRPHEFQGPLRVDDVIRGRLVRVAAGKTVRGADVSLRWGRHVRAPYAEVGQGKGAEGSTPITGAWGRACSGVRVYAERPNADGDHDEWLDEEWSTTTLTVDYPANADVYFDWVGPYRDWEYVGVWEETPEGGYERTGWRFLHWPQLSPYLDIGSRGWRIERRGSTIRQQLKIAWPTNAEPTLRIRSGDGTCGSEPLVVCDFTGCELRQAVAPAGGAPRAVGSIADRRLRTGSGATTIPISGRFSDPDGDRLRYSASSSRPEVVRTGISGDNLILTPVNAGSARVTVTATDPGGLSATQSFGVTVEAAAGSGVCRDSRATPSGSSAALVRDCGILLAAKDALRGTANLNWSTDLSLDSWDGVWVSDVSKGITALYLASWAPDYFPVPLETRFRAWADKNERLTGTIPDSLGGLTDLEYLGLGAGDLTGSIPHSLGSLTHLRWLGLWRNKLTGPLPQSLENLSDLEHLGLGGNDLTGRISAWLGDLTRLEELYLWGNELTGAIPRSLENLTNLERLNLSDNDLTGSIPAWLGGLTNLRVLRLWGNELTGPIPRSLRNLTNLEALGLGGSGLTGTVPDWLGEMTSLESLSLTDSQLTGPIPGSLRNLTNLRFLSLRVNDLTGPIPDWLGDLRKLETVSLRENRLTGPIPDSLQNLTNLELLWVFGNDLTGAVPAWLGRLSNLTRLRLSENQLTGAIPNSLGNLMNLEELWLSENRLTGCIPATLEQFLSTINPQQGGVQLDVCGTANQAPRAVGSIPGQSLDEDGNARTIDVGRYFRDPDGDRLRYAASSSRTSVVRVHVSGSNVTLDPGNAGTATVTVTATDPGGLSATQRIAVTVERSGPMPGGACVVGLELSPGQFCTVRIPGINVGTDRFEVRSDGQGCYGFICSSRAVVLNGFRAGRISGTNRWRIDAVP